MNARLRAHACRSLGVGLFAAWVVVADRLLGGGPMSIGRFVLIAAGAAGAWFLTGSGSGVLWSLLPAPRDPGR